MPKKRFSNEQIAFALIGASKPTATRATETLISAGVLSETTGKKRGRYFAFRRYIDHLGIGTELDRS